MTCIYKKNLSDRKNVSISNKNKCVFFCREDMEKVNIVFHNNGTVSYQHKKILNFVPEMSEDGDIKVMVPNIPLLVSLCRT